GQCRSEGENIFIITSHIEDQSVFPAVNFDIPFHAFLEYFIGKLPVRGEAVLFGHFDSDCQPEPVNISDYLVFFLQSLETGKEIRSLLSNYFAEIIFSQVLHDSEACSSAQGVTRKCRMCGTGRERMRIDQFLPGPEPGERIQTVGKRLCEG